MRLKAALEGNLEVAMDRELEAAARGIERGVQETSDQLKYTLRDGVKRAFRNRRRSPFTGRLEKTWQNKYYKNQRFNAAALVYSKAPHIISAHTKGAVIRAKRGRFLAVPNPDLNLGRGLNAKKRVTPRNWPARLGKLVFIRNKHGSGARLVVQDVRVTKAGRLSHNVRTKTGKFRKGTQSVVAFFLVPQIRLRKRLDIDRPIRRAHRALVRAIQRHYR